jgi:aerobic C4-dicarboxylate transport protein
LIAARSRRAPIARQLWFQVLVATIAGVFLGHYWPSLGEAAKPLGDIFIAMIRMMIGPIIFCTLVHGIGTMKDMASVGRIAIKSLIYFETVTTLALVIALVAVNVWQPGSGMNVDSAGIGSGTVSTYVATAHEQTVSSYLLHIVPRTFVSAFSEGDVLPILFVSVLAGLAFAAVGEHGKPAMAVIESMTAVFFKIVQFIMIFAPAGAFGAIAFTVGKFGLSTLTSLGSLVAEFFVVCALFTTIVFGVIARLAGISLWLLLNFIRDEIFIVAATTSTETVLPRVMQKLEELGCEERVVGFVVPAGYSFNLDGTCLYLATVTVFLAQATNTHLSIWQQFSLLAVLLLTSKGAAGVAGAAFVVLAATLSTASSIPVASISLVLGIHRILAEGLTFVNLVGNCLASIVVARWEGALDQTKLAQIGAAKGAHGQVRHYKRDER